MKKVQPRFTWWDNLEDHGMNCQVTLDNTEEDYCFAFRVTAEEILSGDISIINKRTVEAAKVLMADYAKRHGKDS